MPTKINYTIQNQNENYVTTNQEGTTGDGIQMIQKVGGALVDMKEIQIHPTVQQSDAFLVKQFVERRRLLKRRTFC